MPEKVDCVVIGAGVVGLACARELAMAGREVIILEQADAIGTADEGGVVGAGAYGFGGVCLIIASKFIKFV